MKLSRANVTARLHALRIELTEHAYTLETQGRLDAADVAIVTAGRVGELHAALGGPARRPKNRSRSRRGATP